MLREEVPILREKVIGLRREVRSELQSFYERISTLIKRSFAYPAPDPPSLPSPPPPLEARKEPPSHSPLPLQAEKEADVAATRSSDDTAHAAADTPTPTADPRTDMVYFF